MFPATKMTLEDFVTTKDVFCYDEHMFKTFVATKLGLL